MYKILTLSINILRFETIGTVSNTGTAQLFTSRDPDTGLRGQSFTASVIKILIRHKNEANAVSKLISQVTHIHS